MVHGVAEDIAAAAAMALKAGVDIDMQDEAYVRGLPDALKRGLREHGGHRPRGAPRAAAQGAARPVRRSVPPRSTAAAAAGYTGAIRQRWRARRRGARSCCCATSATLLPLPARHQPHRADRPAGGCAARHVRAVVCGSPDGIRHHRAGSARRAAARRYPPGRRRLDRRRRRERHCGRGRRRARDGRHRAGARRDQGDLRRGAQPRPHRPARPPARAGRSGARARQAA